MDAVGCDEEQEKHELQAGKGDVGCDEEGGCWTWREDGLKEVG